MERLDVLGDAPRPIQVIADTILDTSKMDMHLYHASIEEVSNQKKEENYTFQLIHDKELDKYFYCGARTEDTTAAGILLPNNFAKVIFTEVDAEWIHTKQVEKEKYNKLTAEEKQEYELAMEFKKSILNSGKAVSPTVVGYSSEAEGSGFYPTSNDWL